MNRTSRSRQDPKDSRSSRRPDLALAAETPLDDPIAGTSGFAEEFAARGPRDSRGRSLRDFDLQRRLFKYPCSYLIYSEAFDALPGPARDHVYHRLLEVLSGRDQDPAFARVSAPDRQAILEILLATKRGLPDEWKDALPARREACTGGPKPDEPSSRPSR